MNNTDYKALSVAECADILKSSAKEGKKALIIGHRNPDGDAAGSVLALKRLYEALGGSADCACCDKIPDYLSFLPDSDHLITEIKEEYGLYVAVDVASPQQLGELEYLKDKISITIDHHASYTPFSDNLRDPSASAAGELIYMIYSVFICCKLTKEDADIARLLYAAISADSGSFRYSNTSPKTHMIAADLMKTINSDKEGMSTSYISMLLHDQKSMKEIRAMGMCIEFLETCECGRIAYVIIEKAEAEKLGLSDEDFGSAIDIPRKIKGTEIAFTVKETGKTGENGLNIYKISARSNTEANVSEICAAFGGGGHPKAAGASVQAKSAKEAAEILCSEFKKALRS